MLVLLALLLLGTHNLLHVKVPEPRLACTAATASSSRLVAAAAVLAHDAQQHGALLGRLGEARDEVRRVLEAEPANAEAKEAMAMIEKAMAGAR